MNARKKKILHMEMENRIYDRTTAPPIPKKRRTATLSEENENPAVSILSLPPELLESILLKLSVSDVLSFGSTCRLLHALSLSQLLWRKLYFQLSAGPAPSNNQETDWRRLTILKKSQGLIMQRLSKTSAVSSGGPSWQRGGRRQLTTRSFNSPIALGFRRVVPILDHTLLWDHKGTILVLFTPRGNITWRRPFRYSVLCHHAKDFAVDPRTNLVFRQYIYVLVSRVADGAPCGVGPVGPIPYAKCECVEVFQWSNHQKIFRMTFHSSLSFTQVRLSGPETDRSLLLVTDSGKVYALSVNETHLNTPSAYTVQLTLKRISHLLPDLPVKQVHTNHNSVLYITADGSVYSEVHTPGAYRQLFGTYKGYNPHHAQAVLPISLPYKVVKCSMGVTHLCLLDNCGRVFMQGCNRHGQLGTGDKIDRGNPTLVVVSMAPVDVWCGLNHTLALLEGESGDKQVQGCGCGSGGRLPGWGEGSPVFVRLNVKVPRTATSLCTSRECLFLLSSHDITAARAHCYIPPGTEHRDGDRGQMEEKERLHVHLAQMRRCDSTRGLVFMLQSAVHQYMTGLSPAHTAFLDTALAIILDHCNSTTVVSRQHCKT